MTKTKEFFNPSDARELYEYDPDTGLFTHIERPLRFFANEAAWKAWNSRNVGLPAFTTVQSRGYLHGKVFGSKIGAHRLAFVWMEGYWPDQVDHINGDPLDNRWVNLREANSSVNQRNAKLRNDNTSGHCGVSLHSASGKWLARIGVDGRLKKLGAFKDKADAIAARKAAEVRYGYHENHGRAR